MIARFRLHPKAFTRQRELPFHRLVALMLNLRKGSTELELGGFFATLLGVIVSLAVPTRAAFAKARKHLSEQLFVYLNGQAIETFCAGWSAPLWQGFRLRAVDGSTFRLPPGDALARAFGAQKNGPTLARASVLYDIGHDLVVDARVAAMCVGEHELAIEHLAVAQPGALLLYDRGYPAFWFFALHLAAGIDFCMRLPRSSFAAAEAFWDSEEPETVVTLVPSAEQRRACRDQAVSAEPIRVRLVRVRLSGGETEVLATSVLDAERIPARLFAQLYHKRWGVEIYQPCCLRKKLNGCCRRRRWRRYRRSWSSAAVLGVAHADVQARRRRPKSATAVSRHAAPGGPAASPCAAS